MGKQGRGVTRNQLLRYTLDRQGLIDRKPLVAITALGVLHGTDHTTPYLSLLARLEGFRWEHLADQIYDEGFFSRLRCMRGTVHLVPADIVEWVKCIYVMREDEPFAQFEEYKIPREAVMEMRFFITEVLQTHGAQSASSIKKYLNPDLVSQTYRNKYGQITAIGPVMRWMWQLGLLESGVGVHHWRSKDDDYRLAQDPPPDCDDAAKHQATVELARHYFATYAPASFEDWAWWCGLKKTPARAAFDALQGELEEVQVEGMAETLWLPSDQRDALDQTPDEIPRMVRLLPYEDALIKAYKETRYRFYDDDGLAEGVAITQGGEALPTMWLDGRIMGVWSWVKKANEPMTVDPFQQITRETRKRFKPEVERVQVFIEASHVLWST
jgi:hypothetical protein